MDSITSFESNLKNFSVWLAIFLLGLVLPLILISVISFTGYSEIVEEAAKAALIFVLILKLPNLKQQIAGVLIFGFLFGLSESMFYLNNIFQNGNFNIFWQRFFTAVPMHIITALTVLFFAKLKKWWIFAGFVSAVVLHILYNLLILKY